ncbi:CocE/NonD family hydrolase [Corynebacterium glutamicum]|uniref:CocE/NonD family hydrolase n=1 Tax=Corynebacterium glutamicum TaxID=1718 RepID=UPI001B8CDC54|nr:CocE/NonD family hydrolase [Corynebacterium glutamicum]
MTIALPVLIETDLEATMDDGVVLRATVYRPAVEDAKYPVLLSRTPYGRDLGVNSAYLNPVTIAASGYVVIIQDCRGRFGSEGEFLPSVFEERDGAQSVSWAAQLPYSDGRVGMFGRSYFAETQWRAAQANSPELAALALGVSAGSNANNGALYRGGAFELGSRFGWGHASISLSALFREHQQSPQELAQELSTWEQLDEAFADGSVYNTLPLKSLAPQMSNFMNLHVLPSAGQHPDNEFCRLWDSATEQPVQLPTMHIGGWFDIFSPNTLDQYQRQLEATKQVPELRPRLILGPWSHTNLTGTFPDTSFGMGASANAVASYGDLSAIHRAWFDAILKGDREALEKIPPVLIFFMGENQWRSFEQLPQPEKKLDLFLGADGTLQNNPGADESLSYIYDPKNPVPTAGGATMIPGAFPAGPAIQNQIEEREDVLVFTSAPLEQDLTVFGELTAQLFASTSAVDTDFVVRLCKVSSDDTSTGIADGIVRGSWREACSEDGKFRPGIEPRLLNPGTTYQFSISLWATAYTFSAGDRIRVQVTSSSHPRWDRNLNTGKLAYESAESAPAQQQIFTGAHLPSRISMQVL